MTSGLEDKIIAYFDGELSDADSAELLHLASVSPEIRDLFREHEMLRELAHEATRSAVVSPQIESSLFSRIQALAENPVRNRSVLVFSRRAVVFSALALMALSASLGYFIPKLLSSPNNPEIASVPINPSSYVSTNAKTEPSLVNNDIPNDIAIAHALKGHISNKKVRVFASMSKEGIGIPVNNQDIENRQDRNIVLPAILPVSIREEEIHSDLNTKKLSPFELRESISEPPLLFEIALQTSSGFTYPADATPIKPFADQRLNIAYHLTANNLIGFRLGSGLYQQLGAVTRQDEGGVVVLHRGIETKRSFSEELYYSYLVPLFVVAPFTLEFSFGAGLIPNGSVFGFEAGIRIPLSETFMFDAAFALSRVHSNALSSQEIITSESAGMKPVVLDGVDIHNTLNGRLHYGIVYRF